MNECQVWWTITGNFGNMMPIDWSKSTARAKQLPTLNLCNPNAGPNAGRHNKKTFQSSEDLVDGLEDEDDLVAADLDMHSLILSSNPQDNAVRLMCSHYFMKFLFGICATFMTAEKKCCENSVHSEHLLIHRAKRF